LFRRVKLSSSTSNGIPEVIAMKGISLLLGIVLFAVAGINTNDHVAASSPERSIILRVTKADPGKSFNFTGSYRIGDTPTRFLIRNQTSRFGIKLQTNHLSATFYRLSGESDLSVEAIEFLGEREIGSVSATGKVVEVYVRPEGDGVRMTVRPVEGVQLPPK